MRKQEEKTSRLTGILEPRMRRRVVMVRTLTARFEEESRFARVALACRACRAG